MTYTIKHIIYNGQPVQVKVYPAKHKWTQLVKSATVVPTQDPVFIAVYADDPLLRPFPK